MIARWNSKTGMIGTALMAACLWKVPSARAQEEAPPAVPAGVEVQARGPIHEAFASLTADPEPSKPIPKSPPKPLDEMPPEEKPAGDVTWIGGYWGWDDERKDFLWISGVWRTAPPGRSWVSGYWREDSQQWRWVPGFWAAIPKETAPGAQEQHAQEVSYLPAPPARPEVAPPPKPQGVESFYVPGNYSWDGTRYVFRAGYWAQVQPGYVWVDAHYRWSPSGYIYVPGYWDLAISRRGMLYAPVYINPGVVRVGFVYTPAYAVSDTVLLDSLFVRPCYCHYYFGDYYAAGYRDYGFESCVVYSRRRYDSIIVYESWERRRDPHWAETQLVIYNDRVAGRRPVPPRTLTAQVGIRIGASGVYATAVLAPASHIAREKGIAVVRLEPERRQEALRHAIAVREVAVQRTRLEVAVPPGQHGVAHVHSLVVPRPQVAGVPAVRAAAPTTTGRGTTTPPARPASTPAPGTKPPLPPAHPGTVPPGTRPGTTPPGTGPWNGQRPGTQPVHPPPGHNPPPKDDKDKRNERDR